MNDPHQEFDFYLRRWQVRLFIGGFTLPPLLAVLMGVVLRADSEAVGIGCTMVAFAFFLTAGLLQGWRSAAAEKLAKARRKQQKAETAGKVEY